MSITRPSVSGQGFYGDDAGVLRWWDGARFTPDPAEDEEIVPASMKQERLDAQIRSFVRAGYRLEAKAGLQAIVRKQREVRTVRNALLALATAGLWLVPLLTVGRRSYHRVVITVDHLGAVRLA